MGKFMRCILLLIIVTMLSCSRKQLVPSEYLHYVQDSDNGLFLQKKVKGVNYSLQYQPTDYLVMLERRSFTVPADTFDILYNHFKGLEHYMFRIATKNIDSIVTSLGDTSKIKSRIVSYVDFGIQKNIQLIEGNDTIPCGICQYDGGNGISDYYNFSLGFPANTYEGDRIFLYQDKLFHTGDIKITIRGHVIKNIPILIRSNH